MRLPGLPYIILAWNAHRNNSNLQPTSSSLYIGTSTMNISTSTIAQSRRKPTQNIIDDEDASELRLGPEFSIHQISHDNVETPLITLNLSETRLLINAALKERRRQENGGDLGDADGNDNDEDEDFSNSNEYVPNYRFFFVKKK